MNQKHKPQVKICGLTDVHQAVQCGESLVRSPDPQAFLKTLMGVQK